MSGEQAGEQPNPDCLPDLAGDYYRDVLLRIHGVLRPETYLEIGSETGESLALARCDSIAIDPIFRFSNPEIIKSIINRPSLHLYQMTSDEFFKNYDPKKIFGTEVELAFLDGMHRCEFLLRDFINTEKHCRRNSLIILHDCIPVERAIASRMQGDQHPIISHRREWWAGDVWRAALLLKRRRSDLKIVAVDAQPTGLIFISNLDPQNKSMSDGYSSYVDEMLSWSLDGCGLVNLHREMNIISTTTFFREDEITARFWI